MRAVLSAPPTTRYPIGGWSRIIARMERRALELGVEIERGRSVQSLPEPPVIIATELRDARGLLADDTLHWLSGNAVCLDLVVEHRRGDPYVVADLQDAGWIERFTAVDRSLAPEGEELIQAQMPIRPDEPSGSGGAAARVELLDASLAGWRERERWRRPSPGDDRTHGRARPAWDDLARSPRDRPRRRRVPRRRHGRGAGLPVGEVAWASAVQAAELALAAVGAPWRWPDDPGRARRPRAGRARERRGRRVGRAVAALLLHHVPRLRTPLGRGDGPL